MKFVFFWMLLGFAPVTLLILGVKEVHIEKLSQCDGITDVELTGAILNYQRRIMTVNSQIIVRRPVGGKIDLILELTKCRMKEDPDTCEFNSRHRVVLDCQQLHSQNKMWSEFVQHITNLPDQCPVSSGEYNMTDAPVSLKNMDRLPLGVGYWKISANGIVKKKVIFCIVAELNIEIQRIRKHKN